MDGSDPEFTADGISFQATARLFPGTALFAWALSVAAHVALLAAFLDRTEPYPPPPLPIEVEVVLDVPLVEVAVAAVVSSERLAAVGAEAGDPAPVRAEALLPVLAPAGGSDPAAPADLPVVVPVDAAGPAPVPAEALPPVSTPLGGSDPAAPADLPVVVPVDAAGPAPVPAEALPPVSTPLGGSDPAAAVNLPGMVPVAGSAAPPSLMAPPAPAPVAVWSDLAPAAPATAPATPVTTPTAGSIPGTEARVAAVPAEEVPQAGATPAERPAVEEVSALTAPFQNGAERVAPDAPAAEQVPLAFDRAALAYSIATFDCSRLTVAVDEDMRSVKVFGHVRSAEDREQLGRRIAGLGEAAQLSLDAVGIVGEPYCRVLEFLERPELSRSEDQRHDLVQAVGRSAEAAVLALSGGMPLQLYLRGPAFSSYLYVDYFTSDGRVYHLFPGPQVTAALLETEERIVIGGPGGKGVRATIGPPYGLDMVVALASNLPLFAAPRPLSEAASDHLANMAGALSAAKGRRPNLRVEYSYFLIRTMER